MPAHHRLANGKGIFCGLARQIVDLRSIASCAASGAAAGEHERTAHPVILNVSKRGQPLEFGDRTSPQVIGALDDLGHVSRHLVGAEREQVGAHGLVDRILLTCPHQLDGLRPHPGLHPLPHPGRTHTGEFTLGHLAHDLLYLLQLGLGVAYRSAAQIGIDHHPTVVNPLVDVVVGQFLIGQRAQGLADGAHGADVLFAIRNKFGHQRRVVVERAVLAWDRQQPNQCRATVVFTHLAGHGAAYILQTAG